MEDYPLDFRQVDQLIEKLYPQMEADLLALLAFPSVEGAQTATDMPFGPDVAAALECSLAIASSLKMTTNNIDGYLGIAQIVGSGTDTVGILAHVDVVPASDEDWLIPPFEPQVKDGRIYGRGALDDKGPLIASLYAGAALRQVIARPLDKTVRYMFGGNEESGFRCIRYYLEKFTPPATGFSPDAQFPLVIGEKGIIHFSLDDNWSPTGKAPLELISLTGGKAANIVPDTATAIFSVNSPVIPPDGDNILIEEKDGQLIVIAKGKAAHASTPDEGKNALAALLGYLASYDFAPLGAKKYLDLLAKIFTDSCYGSSLGLTAADEYSKLTLIPSMIRVTAKHGALTCDMRFPISQNLRYYRERLEQIAQTYQLTLGSFDGHEPMFGGKDNPTAQALLAAYREYSRDMSEPLVIGGGTYAKAVPGFFAFGPEFPDTHHLCHQSNEYISCRDLLDAAKIYARAIYKLTHLKQ